MKITCCCSFSSPLHPHEDCFHLVSPPVSGMTEPDIMLKKFAVEISLQTFESCSQSWIFCSHSFPLTKRPTTGHPIYPKTSRQIVLIVCWYVWMFVWECMCCFQIGNCMKYVLNNAKWIMFASVLKFSINYEIVVTL